MMMPKDVEAEIEKLRLKKIGFTNRLNLTDDYDEKEELRTDIERIQKQMDTLEKFK